MGSGLTRYLNGAGVGSGSDLDIKVIGFKPRCVHIINITSGDELWWNDTMADDKGYKRVAAGTGAMISSNGITPLPEGFSFGADTDLNVDGEGFTWEVWG